MQGMIDMHEQKSRAILKKFICPDDGFRCSMLFNSFRQSLGCMSSKLTIASTRILLDKIAMLRGRIYFIVTGKIKLTAIK